MNRISAKSAGTHDILNRQTERSDKIKTFTGSSGSCKMNRSIQELTASL